MHVKNALLTKHGHGRTQLFLVCLFLPGIGTAQTVERQLDEVEFFEKQIRPILVEHCYDCHGPDEASGGLRLDQKSGWERGGEGGPAIVPGDASASLLIRAVSWQDAELKMPPEDAGGKLTDLEIDALTTWIRRGAVDPRTGDDFVSDIDAAARDHWSLQPVTPPQIPDGVHPVDHLVDRRIRESGFKATELADIHTLARRATFDLHGLPPTSEQVAASRESFPHLIRELLASPRYGERWGRHWLDVARYSDAKDGVLMYGDERIRPFAYTYRDYVIRAFNEDKPFDDFIREQLAADQLRLPENSPNYAAMGFLTLGRMFDNNRHDVIDDQIDVVTRGFLGLTVSCARCHDHKFDPIPTDDYYSLYGVFASCLEPWDRPRIAAVTESGQDFETEFAAKLKEVYAAREAHFESTLNTARDRTPDYLVKVATTEPDINETSIFFLSLLPDQLRPHITWRWRQLVARRAYPDDPVFSPWHDLMQDPVLRTEEWRQRGVDQRIIDGLEQARPQTAEEIARTYGQILRRVWTVEKDLNDQIAELDARLATLDSGAKVHDLSQKSADSTPDPVVDLNRRKNKLQAQRDSLALAEDPLGALLVSHSSPTWFPKQDIYHYLSRHAKDAFRKLVNELDAISVKHRNAASRAMVLVDSEQLYEPVIFQRGDPGQRGTPVPRRFLRALSPVVRSTFPDGSGRMNLADAIADPKNPLTSRVWVNRVWMHHFGEPLVENPNDFGLRTQRPIYHELLDFLADYLVVNGWRTKPLHELIMTSQAYQRSAQIAQTPQMTEQLEADSDNRLIWHANRRRLDLEQMRDTMLAVSGRLDVTMYGRPLLITDPENTLRTVYAFVERQNIPDIVQTFDFANADTSTARRVTTTVPQQALFAMNSEFVAQAAAALADRTGDCTAAECIIRLYSDVYGRPPSDDELELAQRFLTTNSVEQLAQVLLMSNELMFVE